MTLKTYLFEGGANGVACTTTNVPGASQVTATGGSSATFSTAMAQSGSTGLQLSAVSGTSDIVRTTATASNTQMAFSGVLTTPASTPSANLTVMTFLDTTAAVCLRLLYDTSNRLVIQVKSGTFVGYLGTSLTVGTKYRVEIVATGGSASASVINAHLYTPTGTTPLFTVSSTSANMGTNALNGGDLGDSGAATTAVIGWDNVQWNDGATSEIGPYVVVNVPPTASFTHSESGLTTSVNGTASTDSDGTITAYDWNWGDSTTHGTGSTSTHTYTAAGTYTVTLTVTDNSAATGTATGSVTVSLTAAATVRPTTDITNTGQTIVGGSSTMSAALADESDTTYLQSPDNPSGGTSVVKFPPLSAGLPSLVLRHYASSATPAITRTYNLVQGTTVISTRNVVLPTTITNYTFSSTSGEAANITDRTDLRLSWSDTV